MAGEKWQETGYVFTTTMGTPMDGSVVTHGFQKMLARTGWPRMRFHDLRRCKVTLNAVNGVPARVTMAEVGHSQIATTMDIYTDVLDSQLIEAAEAIEAALGG